MKTSEDEYSGLFPLLLKKTLQMFSHGIIAPMSDFIKLNRALNRSLPAFRGHNKFLSFSGKEFVQMPLDFSGQDNVGVGRVRDDISVENGLALFACGDQLLKGAALNAVQIAELIVE